MSHICTNKAITEYDATPGPFLKDLLYTALGPHTLHRQTQQSSIENLRDPDTDRRSTLYCSVSVMCSSHLACSLLVFSHTYNEKVLNVMPRLITTELFCATNHPTPWSCLIGFDIYSFSFASSLLCRFAQLHLYLIICFENAQTIQKRYLSR